MAIDRLLIGNFKGIGAAQSIDIKPLTIFVGGNSTGKSTCIHALACLSQTVKVTNNTRPLILDDEFASVHLGRFIEVIHSRSYQDVISLGVTIKRMPFTVFAPKDGKGRQQAVSAQATASAEYAFKCTLRTQDIHLTEARIAVGDHQFTAKKDKQGYLVTKDRDGTRCRFAVETAFLLGEASSSYDNPEDYMAFYPLRQFQARLKRELSNTLYLGPFRQAPRRKYPTRGSSPSEVGAMGESTVTLLANEIVQTQTRTHIAQIAHWLSDLGLAKTLAVTRLAQSDIFDVSLTLQDGEEFPLADLGYGVSQVLPVLTQCSFAKPGTTLLFEQPEIHLHTIAARRLARVFIQTFQKKGCHVVVETHSPELVKQVFCEIREGSLSVGDVVIYKVTREDFHTQVRPIAIEGTGCDIDVYDNWEQGISM